MKRRYFRLGLVVLIIIFLFVCLNDSKDESIYVDFDKKNIFKDLILIDKVSINLGNIDENWTSVINAVFHAKNQKLILTDTGYRVYKIGKITSRVYDDERVTIDKRSKTITYHGATNLEDKEDLYYVCFDILPPYLKMKNVSGHTDFTTTRTPSDSKIVKVMDKENWYGLKRQMDYVFYKRINDDVWFYYYVFKCPLDVDTDAIIDELYNR